MEPTYAERVGERNGIARNDKMDRSKTKTAGNSIATVILVIIVLGTSISSTVAAELGCKKVFNGKYMPGRLHKAFATTGARSVTANNTACGWGVAFSTRSEAISEALRQCAKYSKAHKNPVPCKVLEAK